MIEFLKSRILKPINNLWENFISLKIIKNIFLFFPRNLIVFLFFILSIISLFNFYKNNVSNIGITFFNEPTEKYEVIKDKEKVDLSFIDYNNVVNDICLKVGSDNVENEIILSSSFFNKKMSANDINEYGYLCFDVNEVSLTKLKEDDVFISSIDGVKLFKDKDNNVAIQILRKQKSDLKIVTSCVSFIAILLFLLLNYFINTKKIAINSFYIMLCSYFVILLFIIPPFQVPDEVAHFYRSYNFSQPEVSGKISFDRKKIEVPKYIECINYGNLHKSNKVYDINDIQNCLKNTSNKRMLNSEKYGSQILGYLSQTIGIKIVDIFTNSPLLIFFSGRFLTFLVSLIIIYFAIKITPRHKLIFLAVCSMMMFIQQMISYSYDSILNSVSVLFVAYILKFIYEDKVINYKDLIIPSLILLFIINIKIVYLPLCLLFLLIPKDKFENARSKYLLFFLMIIFGVIVSKFLDYSFSINGNGSSTSVRQFNYLISNPLDIFKIAYNTVLEKGIFYLESLVGFFGWFLVKVSHLYLYAYILLFVYIINGEESKIQKKYIIILSILFIVVAVFGALYIVWSDYKLPYVEGVQGRYFFPFLIPLCLVFVPKNKKYILDNNVVYSVINIIMFQFLFVILFTFY